MLPERRDGVIAVITPRMATAESACGVPAASNCAVALKGFNCVHRTRRRIATRRRTSVRKPLIEVHPRPEQTRAKAHRWPLRGSALAMPAESCIRSAIVLRSLACDQSVIGAVTRMR